MSTFIERMRTYSEGAARLAGNDAGRLAKGGLWLSFGYALQVISGLVLAVAFANLLPKETFGAYQFVLSMAAIASVFTLTGMGTALMRAAATGSRGSLRYGVRTQLIASLGIVAASACLAFYYFLQGNPVLGAAFIVVGACQPFITGFGLYKWYLHGAGRFKESALLELLQRILPLLALVLVVTTTTDLLAIVATYFIANAVSLLSIYAVVVRRHRLPVTPDPALRRYSAHLSVMDSFAEIAGAADKVLIWTYLGAAPLAAYALAQMPVMHLQTVFGFARSLAFAKLAQWSIPELRRFLPKRIRQFSLMVLAVVAVYILLAPLLFGLLFPAYPEAVLYSQLLALTVLAVPRSLIGQAFAAHERTKELYVVNITTPILRIALLAGLLPFFGIWGAIAALIMTEAYAATVQLILFRKLA